MKKSDYKNSKTIAAYGLCNTAALLIKEIIFDIEDYVIYETSYDNKIHKAKIYYSNDDQDYFIYNGTKILLSECLRID